MSGDNEEMDDSLRLDSTHLTRPACGSQPTSMTPKSHGSLDFNNLGAPRGSLAKSNISPRDHAQSTSVTAPLKFSTVFRRLGERNFAATGAHGSRQVQRKSTAEEKHDVSPRRQI